MTKINWADRDWRWLLSGWLLLVGVLLFLAGLSAYPLLFNHGTGGAGEVTGTTGSSSALLINRGDLESVVKMINDRANRSLLLQEKPPNLIDPSR